MIDFAYSSLIGYIQPILITIGIVMATVITIRLALKLWDFRLLLNRGFIFLELTPPSDTDRKPEATNQLFTVLYGLGMARTWVDKLLRRKSFYSLEVASSRKDGIRYVVRVPKADATSFQQSISSYLPDIRIKEVSDFLTDQIDDARVAEFRQTGHYAFPLQTQNSLEQHDPIAYSTGLMTKLKPNELIVFQMVLSPTRSRGANSINRRVLRNEDLINSLNQRGATSLYRLSGSAISLILGVISSIVDVILHSGRTSEHAAYQKAAHHQQAAAGLKPARTISAIEQQVMQSVHDKVSQSLFNVNLRALVLMNDKQMSASRMKGIRASLSSFNVPKYQSLEARPDFPLQLRQRYRKFEFKHRLPTFFNRNSCILSTSEIADLYHFPHSHSAKTENVVKSLSKPLPAPLSLKKGSQFDVILGRNNYQGTLTDIGLTGAERERHVLIEGGTGHGKTTMMEYAAIQDIQNGKGAAIIDPHGDFASKLLKYIPEDRIKDVIYFNPADLSYPIGLNLLELPEGLTDDELIEAKDFITESIISIMRKTFSDDDSGGHRIEYILRNSVQTALTVKDATIFTVFDLLTDAKYRKKIVSSLENEKLKNFWKNEFGKAGDFQRVKMAGGVTAKIGRFQFSASAERIMSQPKSTINFEEILDGKILICNFAKGLIGEDTSELFGISILAKLQLAAYRRVKKRQADRKPFYLYVDEFQNFATMSFVQMLSEARKYRLFLTMAEQSTSQQDDQRMVNTLFANVGTVISFRTGNPADEQMLLPLFRPYLNEGDIANLPTHHFYARLAAVLSQEPVSGETLLLQNEGSSKIAEQVIRASRKNHATKYHTKPQAKKETKQSTKKKINSAKLPDAG